VTVAIQQIEDLHAKQMELMDKLLELLDEQVGENPEVTRLGERCFTIKSSMMFRYDNWTPEFYDWKQTIRLMIEKMSGMQPIHAIAFLRRVAKTGKIEDRRGHQTMHPALMRKIQGIVEGR
jgi:hypothetical protein